MKYTGNISTSYRARVPRKLASAALVNEDATGAERAYIEPVGCDSALLDATAAIPYVVSIVGLTSAPLAYNRLSSDLSS